MEIFLEMKLYSDEKENSRKKILENIVELQYFVHDFSLSKNDDYT